MKYLFSYDLHEGSTKLSNTVREKLESIGCKRRVATTYTCSYDKDINRLASGLSKVIEAIIKEHKEKATFSLVVVRYDEIFSND